MVQASATNPTGTTLTFGLTHVPKKMEGFPVNQQQTFTMDLAAARPNWHGGMPPREAAHVGLVNDRVFPQRATMRLRPR